MSVKTEQCSSKLQTYGTIPGSPRPGPGTPRTLSSRFGRICQVREETRSGEASGATTDISLFIGGQYGLPGAETVLNIGFVC